MPWLKSPVASRTAVLKREVVVDRRHAPDRVSSKLLVGEPLRLRHGRPRASTGDERGQNQQRPAEPACRSHAFLLYRSVPPGESFSGLSTELGRNRIFGKETLRETLRTDSQDVVRFIQGPHNMELETNGSSSRLEHASEPIQDYPVDDCDARSPGWDG